LGRRPVSIGRFQPGAAPGSFKLGPNEALSSTSVEVHSRCTPRQFCHRIRVCRCGLKKENVSPTPLEACCASETLAHVIDYMRRKLERTPECPDAKTPWEGKSGALCTCLPHGARNLNVLNRIPKPPSPRLLHFAPGCKLTPESGRQVRRWARQGLLAAGNVPTMRKLRIAQCKPCLVVEPSPLPSAPSG